MKINDCDLENLLVNFEEILYEKSSKNIGKLNVGKSGDREFQFFFSFILEKSL